MIFCMKRRAYKRTALNMGETPAEGKIPVFPEYFRSNIFNDFNV